MIRPSRRFVFLLLALGLSAFGPIFFGPIWVTIWLGICFAAFLALVVDAIAAPSSGAIEVTTGAPRELYIGDTGHLTVRLDLKRGRPRDLELVVETGPGLDPLPTIHPDFGAAREVQLDVPIRPHRRGNLRVERLHLRWSGPLSLCEYRRVDQLDVAIAVVPNLRLVRETALAFATRPEFLAGIKADRILGDGSDFDRLREFVSGMDIRAIDWKSSARHRRLMARQYRAERNHLVVMSIDTGRLMGEELDGLPRLDHAVNASLLLAWSCLKTGDRVALHAFDERSRKFVEAEGGVRALPRIRSATADLEYSNAETNFTLGLSELGQRLRRRAMVVVFTEFADSITAEIMVDNLLRLARRHLILFVTLRDRLLDEAADTRAGDLDGVGRAVVTAELLRERRLVQKRLERAGVHCLDVLPERLTSDLLQTYLDIKNRELL